MKSKFLSKLKDWIEVVLFEFWKRHRRTEILTYNPNFDFGAIYTNSVNAYNFFNIYGCTFVRVNLLKVYLFSTKTSRTFCNKCCSICPPLWPIDVLFYLFVVLPSVHVHVLQAELGTCARVEWQFSWGGQSQTHFWWGILTWMSLWLLYLWVWAVFLPCKAAVHHYVRCQKLRYQFYLFYCWTKIWTFEASCLHFAFFASPSGLS